jgi:DNA-directed RNA polymerase specialized sigma24 family protein
LCHGLGLVQGRLARVHRCRCVWRAIFRACLDRYRSIQAKQERGPLYSGVGVHAGSSGHRRGPQWQWKNLDYCADFVLVARRELDPRHYQVFRLHFLEGRQHRDCTLRLGLSRGNFFHAVYRIQQKLGQRFLELHPYGLWPLHTYFGD